MNEAILLVDDDVRVVSALQRSLYRTYRIEIAAGAQDALDAIGKNSYAVVVSDLQMPGMNGVELLTHVKRLSPGTVRILLTGQADLDAAIAAVNEGNVFRFLTKPCPQEILCKTLDAALEQHRLQVAEKEVLQETLMGTVAILVEILSAIQPVAFGRGSRTRQHVRLLAAELDLPDSWEFEAAAMLSQIGCISVDPRVLKRHYAGEELAEADRRHLLAHASVGRKLLHKVPRLQAVAQMIERQYEDWQSCSTSDPKAHLIAMGAQMLRATLEFDRLIGIGKSTGEALTAMRRAENEYHPGVLAALERLKDKLPQGNGLPEASEEYVSLHADELIFRPIADQVLRSLRA
ncbi:MAG: response regulator [Bryobacteraceae bacterium]|jgi:response regulator RpfG family c-di-GMP phosphodiesterase